MMSAVWLVSVVVALFGGIGTGVVITWVAATRIMNRITEGRGPRDQGWPR